MRFEATEETSGALELWQEHYRISDEARNNEAPKR